MRPLEGIQINLTDDFIKRNLDTQTDTGTWVPEGKTMWEHIQKVAIYKLTREASGEIKSAETLILNF